MGGDMTTIPTKRLVVSAVNLIEGGPLTVLIESLEAAVATLDENWDIIALVHDAKLISNQRVRTMVFPESKRSWLNRLLLEWYGFYALSKELQPDLWVSLHDITPRVVARRQVVYCHNSSPFYRVTWHEAWLEPKFLLFNLFYAQLYRVFIHRNAAVIVQQDWLRQAFVRLYKHSNIVVAHPTPILTPDIAPSAMKLGTDSHQHIVLLYPALPRVFKNMEVLCDAVAMLPAAIVELLEIRFTVAGNENRYARYLIKRYGQTSGIRFIGRQTRSQMEEQYTRCDAVMFPSKLETWGLPITEAKALGKPLLVADLPYAHETVGTYDNVSFLSPTDPTAWAEALLAIVDGSWRYSGHVATLPAAPFAPDWRSLWKLLTEGL
jgi:glycosyltransferase involved in cell wall biosynthesis